MKSSTLPSGYKPVGKNQVSGRLNNLSPQQQALQRLMVRDPDLNSNNDIKNASKIPDKELMLVSDAIKQSIRAKSDLRSITHYIKRAEQIYITLLTKPNGEQESLFTYDTYSSKYKNTALHQELLGICKNHFLNEYRFENDVNKIIRDVLFRTGSYCLVNMSYPALDHIINGMDASGFESLAGTSLFNKAIDSCYHDINNNRLLGTGWVRKKPTTAQALHQGFESLYRNEHNPEPEFDIVDPALKWTFTDSLAPIYLNKVKQERSEVKLLTNSGFEDGVNAVANIFKSRSKAHRKENPNHIAIQDKDQYLKDLEQLYGEKRRYKEKDSIVIRKDQFYTGSGKGSGMVMKIPSGAAIPIHARHDKEEILGIVILTDPKTGVILDDNEDAIFYRSLSSQHSGMMTPNTGMTLDDSIRALKEMANGGSCDMDLSYLTNFISAEIEKEIVESFMNGDKGVPVSVTLTDLQKQVYLSRAIKQQGVRAIYIPYQYCTYFAIDWNNSGSGRSLVDEAKPLITRLAALDIADAIANMENAISKQEIVIGLEKQNFDPKQLIAQVRNEWFVMNPSMYEILGYNSISVDTILDRYKQQSLTLRIERGDNKNTIAPEFRQQLQEREILKPIDRDSREYLLNGIAGMFFLKRTWLEDTGEGNDFAVEAMADQEQLRNQILEKGKQISIGCSDHLRKYIVFKEELRTDLINTIIENAKLYKDPDQGDDLKYVFGEKANEEEMVTQVYQDFIRNFYVELPKPALTESFSKLNDRLKIVNDLVDDWLEMGYGDKMLDHLSSTVELETDTIKDVLKSVFKKEAYRMYNLPTPFEEIIDDGKGGGLAAFVLQGSNVVNNIIEFLTEYGDEEIKARKKLNKLKEKLDKKRAKLEESENEEEVGDGGENTEEPLDTGSSTFTDGGDETEEETEESTTTEDGDTIEETTTEESTTTTEEPPEDPNDLEQSLNPPL